jgi:GNAT superfamily N-acetyltransferase
MEEPYGAEWSSEEKIKRQEMVAPEARYIFIKQYLNGFTTECSMNQDAGVEHNHAPCNEGCLVGFVHYRFVLEEELPVVYVYELQMEPSAQGKGLGKFMMQLIEQIACKVIWSIRSPSYFLIQYSEYYFMTPNFFIVSCMF